MMQLPSSAHTRYSMGIDRVLVNRWRRMQVERMLEMFLKRKVRGDKKEKIRTEAGSLL